MDSAHQAFTEEKAVTLDKQLPDAFFPGLACKQMCLLMNEQHRVLVL